MVEYKERDVNKRFPWGRVVEDHVIGKYTFREFYSVRYERCHPVRDPETGAEVYEDKTSWHPYINGKDTNRSYTSLESAMIGVIALQFDGLNTKADRYFELMIGMDKETDDAG